MEERKALNYLVQSTTSDMVLENAYKITKALASHKSFLAFTVHDSIVIDYSREDNDLVRPICSIIESSNYGNYVSRVQIVKNFGDMKEVQI